MDNMNNNNNGYYNKVPAAQTAQKGTGLTMSQTDGTAGNKIGHQLPAVESNGQAGRKISTLKIFIIVFVILVAVVVLMIPVWKMLFAPSWYNTGAQTTINMT